MKIRLPGKAWVLLGWLTVMMAKAQDVEPPAPDRAYHFGRTDTIWVGFSEEVSPATAGDVANYQVSGGVTVATVTPADGSRVRLTTSALTLGTRYTVTVQNVADTAGNRMSGAVSLVVLDSQGAITVRAFSGIFGGSVDVLPETPEFPDSPTEVFYPGDAEWASTEGIVGYQMVGFVHPPITGNYEFFVAGENTATRLFLSPSDDPSAKESIIDAGASGERNFVIGAGYYALEAGRKYYIEAWGKRQWGGGSFALGWRFEPWLEPRLITAEYLSTTTSSGAVGITTPPESTSVAFGDPLSLRVTAAGSPPYSYQWRRNGTDIAGATGATYAVSSATADTAGSYTVVVGNRFSSATSPAAAVTVESGSGVPGPHLISAASVQGGPIGVRFDTALDPVSAGNAANYRIFGVGASLTVTQAVARADGRSVELRFQGGALPDPFTVKAEGIKTAQGTEMGEPGLILGAVLDLTAEDIGGPVEKGSVTSLGAGSLEVEAGGLRTWDTSDSFYFVHAPVTGDFDVRVRVDSVEQLGAKGGDPKAALMARADNSAGSPNVSLNVVATRGYLEYLYRPEQDGGTTEFNPSTSPGLTFPQWIRLQRAGDTFTAFRSANGTEWTQISEGEVPMPPSIRVGLNTNPDIDTAGARLKVQYSGLSIAGADQGFVSEDIGEPVEAGRVTFGQEPGVVDVVAGGLRTWDTSDSFNFVHKRYTGDFDVKVRVDSVAQNGAPGGDPKAALMVRANLTPGSANVSLNVVSTRGYLEYLYRPAQDGGTTEFNPSTSPGLTYPQWIRLRRAGNLFIAYRSRDGVAWTRVSEGEVDLPAEVEVGLNTNADINQAGATVSAAYTRLGDVSEKVRLPDTGLSAIDIGAPIEPGYVTTPGGLGDIDVVAGGLRTWDTSDSFHFVHTERTGDFDVRVRVDAVEQLGAKGGDPKAALMARENLTPGSPNVSLNVVSTRGYLEYLYRPVQDGGTTEFDPSTSPGLTYPQWVRLKRAGDLFTAFRSADGTTWAKISEGEVVMTPKVFVGLNTNADRDEAGALLSVRYRRFGDTPLVPVSPVVAVRLDGGQVVLSWPGSAAGFVVEGTGSLVGAAWSQVPGSPVLEGGRFTVRLPVSGSSAYFRLRLR